MAEEHKTENTRADRPEGGDELGSKDFVASAPLPAELPQSLKEFMDENGVDKDLYKGAEHIDRHIRINPRNPITLLLLAAELQQQIAPVPWLSGIYSLSASARLASAAAYKTGKIYGIDVASAAAVQALKPQPGDRILDLCCAPGAKLCMISDSVLSDKNPGFVVGVDVSQQRLASTRTMVRKYQQNNIRLYLSDGTKCTIPCPSTSSAEEAESERKEVLRAASEANRAGSGSKRSRKKAYQSQSVHDTDENGHPLRYFFESSVSGHWTWRKPGRFDRVIVDAECTHDGSIRHIAKFESWGWDTMEKRFLADERLSSLEQLQRDLLSNGFQHLKPGGTLVYSTCSFAKRQNEDIVAWFLHQEPQAKLERVDGRETWPCREGHIPNTLRFDPASSGSSGLFLARFVRLSSSGSKLT